MNDCRSFVPGISFPKLNLDPDLFRDEHKIHVVVHVVREEVRGYFLSIHLTPHRVTVLLSFEETRLDSIRIPRADLINFVEARERERKESKISARLNFIFARGGGLHALWNSVHLGPVLLPFVPPPLWERAVWISLPFFLFTIPSSFL